MFYTSSGSSYVVVELKWNNSLNGKAYLRMNSSGLSNADASGTLNYVTQFNASWNAWNNCASLVTTEKVTSNGNVVYTSLDTKDGTETWRNLVGSSRIHTVLGVTMLRTSDGVTLVSYSAAASSSKKVVYATIYLNPYIQYAYDFADLNADDMRHVLVHETGHALTLGHSNIGYAPTSVASVMQSGTLAYTTPQAHDIGDIKAKYG